jgi:hypothetical protein
MSVFNGCDSHKKSNHTNFIRNTVMTRMLEAQQQHVNVNKVYQESDVIHFNIVLICNRHRLLLRAVTHTTSCRTAFSQNVVLIL